ncbi:hypothetical protein OF117_11135 [Geodermatophilus sp. YIM 151500]|nr:hypothetical protein [Geodermatophilus sp. YIM 151500]MCV2489917.1 hypothetical protein [Geodermatophilus sp. YIM 151500]
MTTPSAPPPSDAGPPQPRDIALEQVTPEQAAALEELSEPDERPEEG